ncbi:hypothetical protein [Pseudactinotalea sp.]|uniref:hypothetical protein n=1 Tax=Pseudactinotalea sp. TaxID=1926260 RepID=UPI003B3BB195
MLIRFTKNSGGHSIGEIMDAANSQGERLVQLGVAIPVEHGKDGRIVIKRSDRKVPRRDRSSTTDEQVSAVD